MKPENIFLRSDSSNFVKIVDFGIAKMNDLEQPGEPGRKLTKTGMIFGTPEYMSPSRPLKPSTTGRYLCDGDHPLRDDHRACAFVGDSFMAVLTQHLLEPVPNMSDVNPAVKISPDLRRLCSVRCRSTQTIDSSPCQSWLMRFSR